MNTTNNSYQPSEELQITDHFYKTKLEGLYYFQSPKYNDDRGFFSQLVILPELEQVIKKPFNIKQINHARSQTNVTRGFHAENWNKLVTVTSGLAFSAVVDLRPDSPTYKQVECFLLGYDHQPEFGTGLYISKGLGNSICVLEGPMSYIYLVDQLYSNRTKGDDQAISLFDKQLAVNWPITKEQMILSQRDQSSVTLEEYEATISKRACFS